MIEYSLILFLIFKSFINTTTQKKINQINEKQLIINEINTDDINYETILDNVKKLLAFYNYEGHVLLSRVKNDLIRDKKNKLNKKMVEKIKMLNNNILINQEIKKINRDMIIYKSNIEYVFKKLRNDIYLNINININIK
jgi:hypothetical protein